MDSSSDVELDAQQEPFTNSPQHRQGLSRSRLALAAAGVCLFATALTLMLFGSPKATGSAVVPMGGFIGFTHTFKHMSKDCVDALLKLEKEEKKLGKDKFKHD